MAPISSTVEVDRPPAEVFGYVTDPARFGQWQRNVTGGHLVADGEPAVGAKCLTTRKIGLVERTVTAEVTRLDPPRAWGVRGLDGPIRAAVDVVVEPVDDGRRSRVTISVHFTGHGIGRLLVPLVVNPQSRKEIPASLRKAKHNLESGSAG